RQLPMFVKGPEAGETKRDSQRKRQAPAGEHRHCPGCVPESRWASALPPALADNTVEQVRAPDDRRRRHPPGAEERGKRWEQDAVREQVVPSVPASVPDREAAALEQLGAQYVGGEVPHVRVP